MAEKPTAAFVLSLIGGIFVLLGGALLAALGAALSGVMAFAGFGDFGLGVTLMGALGAVFGVIMIVGGVMMYMKPEQHVIWGAIVLILAIVSVPFSFIGLILGFILGLIGGILGLVFKPTPPMVMAPPAAWQQPPMPPSQ